MSDGEPYQWKACVLTSANNLVSITNSGLEKKVDENKAVKFVYSSYNTFNSYGIFDADKIHWFH